MEMSHCGLQGALCIFFFFGKSIKYICVVSKLFIHLSTSVTGYRLPNLPTFLYVNSQLTVHEMEMDLVVVFSTLTSGMSNKLSVMTKRQPTSDHTSLNISDYDSTL